MGSLLTKEGGDFVLETGGIHAFVVGVVVGVVGRRVEGARAAERVVLVVLVVVVVVVVVMRRGRGASTTRGGCCGCVGGLR